jgi:hypothetical protein
VPKSQPFRLLSFRDNLVARVEPVTLGVMARRTRYGTKNPIERTET